ncbi:hypothetical protein TWF173_003782 [Orbilia oligospora]|uniref:Uncharacterized protein n=2 Tax=Orbilia oligospora TaxID=2813651 RepID=G1XFM0_ARTOA|nr:hypothetical protein AOL_s00081g162 [Orbilia oligospora ATCC 24927]EGX48058.1 hypothetical protein AOL_s00081g162 [Orbilia oligospora ATCC 24927]KAF3290907.1 hypothetical protein TWF970_000167 [Orbilia oligospora]KAF3319340.1 hypothetical protein TWF173_003782 [Orbilia oligospora]
MSNYQLSIVIYGPGTDPNNRSHWALALHREGEIHGDLFQVLLVDRDRLWYQFDKRTGVEILDKSSEGCVTVATISVGHRRHAKRIMSTEPVPMDGLKRCQDWVADCIVTLEIEEIVEAGTSHFVQRLIGLPASSVAEEVGPERWTETER